MILTEVQFLFEIWILFWTHTTIQWSCVNEYQGVDFYRMDGTAFNGTVASGCCPSFTPGCHLGSGGAVGGVNGFAFGADDPGTPLPITVAAFDATLQQDKSTASMGYCIKWTMIFQYWKITWREKLETITRLEGSGNSTEPMKYETRDKSSFAWNLLLPFNANRLWRNSTSTDPVTVHFGSGENFLVYPNGER